LSKAEYRYLCSCQYQRH